LGDLEEQWRVRIGQPLPGGTASYVATATTGDGTPVVVKVYLTAGIEGQGSFANELTALLSGGPGYVRVLAHDDTVPALLMERLGSPLGASSLPTRQQLAIVASTLKGAWVPAAPVPQLPTLAEKGAWLAEFIERTWTQYHRPCPRAVVDAAIELARVRAAAFDTATAELLHGDGHPMNLLSAADGSYRLIDPDGVIGEREYDLAIPIRELGLQHLQPSPARICRDLCRLMADHTNTNSDAIWQWAYVERVSTGLLCARLGHDNWATQLLEPAELLIS
jgi:streptomycin 6-kinase